MEGLGAPSVSARGIAARLIAFVFGITLFVLGWWWVISRQGVDFWVLVWIALGVVGVVLMTLGWIRWNRRIYRNRGPRRASPAPSPLPVRDQLGRVVDLAPGSLQARTTHLSLRDDEIVIAPDGLL